MFMRIGNQIVNKNMIYGFVKNKTSIILVSEPRKLSRFFAPEYFFSGIEYYYNTESECSDSFENIINDNVLNNYTHKKSYTGKKLQDLLKKADEFEIEINKK